MRGLLVALLGLLLVSCGGEPVELPPAKPLQVSDARLREIPGLGTGTFAVQVHDPLHIETPENRNRALSLRVLQPLGVDRTPVVIFSHGNWSDREKYDELLRVWASHGFAVVAPTHLDGRSMARGIFNSLRYGQMGLIEARVEDITFLLNNLEKVVSNIEGFAKIDERVVVAGHSFGAFTAQQFAGARAIDNGQVSTAGHDRVAGVLAISPPGPMFDVIREESWSQLRGPVLATTGTWDSNPQFWPDWRMHLLSHETGIAGELYALVIEGADHYLGNLICRPEREADPQRDALKILNAMSVAFLRAHLLEDNEARQFLASSQLESLTRGFATLSKR